MSATAITAYNIPLKAKDKIQNSYDVDEFFSLIDLSKQKRIDLLKKIFRFKKKLVFILTNDSESTYNILVFCLFFISSSRQLTLIYPDLKTEVYRKRNALIPIIRCLGLSIWAIINLFRDYIYCFLISKKKTNREIKNRHILYLKSNFWTNIQAGGAVAHLQGVLKGFHEKGFGITYAGMDKKVVSDERIDIPPLENSSFWSELNASLFDQVVFDSLKKRDFQGFDFIYHRYALNSLSALKLARKKNLPLILEFNGSEVWAQKNWAKPLRFSLFSSKIEITNLVHADIIVVVSEALVDELVAKGIPKEKIAMHPNCVNTETYNPDNFQDQEKLNLRRRLGFEAEDTICTFIGTFGKWHGVDVLAEAIKILFAQHAWAKDKKIKFMLIGDGLYKDKVKNILQNEMRNGDVVLTGLIPQSEAPSYLAVSDIFLSPHTQNEDGSRFFGSPTKLFEYMAMSKPIIASELEQLTEILNPSFHIKSISETCNTSDKTAILIPPSSPEDIVLALKWLINNREKSIQLGKNARRKAIDRYTWDKHVEKILDVYSNHKKT